METLSNAHLISGKVALTQRQQEIMELVASGLTSKEIARQLSISPSTVDNHVKAAVDRLGARSRHDAARLIALTLKLPDGGTATATHSPNHRIFLSSLPPLGGKPNQLPKHERLLVIGQIAILAIIGLSAAILTIVGLVHILSR